VVVATKGTIHDTDVRTLESTLRDLPKKLGRFEPMEPDFRLHIEHVNDDEYELTCLVDYQNTVSRIYGTSALGGSILITSSTAQRFAEELRAERITLTKDLDFKDFEAKPLP